MRTRRTDPDDADALRPAYAAPDLLHPDDVGMKVIADAVRRSLG